MTSPNSGRWFPRLLIGVLIASGLSILVASSLDFGRGGDRAIAASPDVGISIGRTGGTLAGTDIDYQVHVTASGGAESTGIVVSDVLPAGLHYSVLAPDAGSAFACTRTALAGQPESVTCALALLTSSATAGFNLQVRIGSDVTDGTTVTNTVRVTSDSDANPSNNSASADFTATTSADLATSVAAPIDALAAQTVDFLITVNNLGPSYAQSLTLTAATPAGTTFVTVPTPTAPPPFNCSTPAVGGTGTVSCTLPSLANSDSRTIDLRVQVGALAPGTTVRDTASVVATTTDPNAANNTSAPGVVTIVQGADLYVTETGPDTLTDGGTATYLITVGNLGPGSIPPATVAAQKYTLPVTPIVLTVMLAPVSTYIGFSRVSGVTVPCDLNLPEITCAISSLTGGQSMSFALVVKVDPAVGQTTTNTATVSGPLDVNLANNTAYGTTSIVSREQPQLPEASTLKPEGRAINRS